MCDLNEGLEKSKPPQRYVSIGSKPPDPALSDSLYIVFKEPLLKWTLLSGRSNTLIILANILVLKS